MATITIRSRLHHFRLINAIADVDADGISGSTDFDHAPTFAGIEAMAQLAALHVRYGVEFARHVFLLKVIRCQSPPAGRLDGGFSIEARKQGGSLDALRYGVTAKGGDGVFFSSDILVGLRDYDHRFQAGRLKGHYRTIFDRLRSQRS